MFSSAYVMIIPLEKLHCLSQIRFLPIWYRSSCSKELGVSTKRFCGSDYGLRYYTCSTESIQHIQQNTSAVELTSHFTSTFQFRKTDTSKVYLDRNYFLHISQMNQQFITQNLILKIHLLLQSCCIFLLYADSFYLCLK